MSHRSDPSAPRPAPAAGQRIPELDGVRGIAILMVVVYHFGRYTPVHHNRLHAVFQGLMGTGWAGVDLFFVLSGCLITGILLDAKPSPDYFRSFYMRRVLRILPLYYLSVFAFFCVVLPAGAALWPEQGLLQAWRQEAHSEAAWFWFHLSNWRSALGHFAYAPVGHFWSLAIEEQFYLVWPLVVLIFDDAGLLIFCALAIACSAGLRNLPWAQAVQARHMEFLYRLTPFRIEPLAFGAAIAVAARYQRWRALARRVAWAPLAAGALVVAAIVFSTGTSAYSTPAMTRYGYTALALVFASVVALAVIHSGSPAAAARFLRNPVLLRFGMYSYAMYVLHAPLGLFLPAWMGERVRLGDGAAAALLSIAIGLAFTYAAAALSWRFIERPFLKLKDRFSYRAARPAEDGAADRAAAAGLPAPSES